MKLSGSANVSSLVNRRSFLKNAGSAAAAVAAIGVAPTALFAAPPPNTVAVDTPKEIFTAALIAEDLATVFYYNGLIGGVIQDVNLAGPGGTAINVSSTGSPSNVGYIRAAMIEEIRHAQLFRGLLGGEYHTFDPYQHFFFDPSIFETLDPFIATLEALENAFIGAYLAAIQQFALLASTGKPTTLDGVLYQPSDFAYYAKIAASILGIESEHRALGRAIVPTLIPANQLNYESTDGIATVYNGPNSAVVALTPFLTGGWGTKEYQLVDAVSNQYVVLPTTGTIPPE